ncbi:MAG: C-GCAxxG-C-C family protein [Candidatus Bathyarchaeia archaeon]
MSLEEVAKRNFNSGFNCAESVLLAVTAELDATGQTKEHVIPRIATGFGGGIGRNGDVCGALTGGVMAISLVFGRDKPEESRKPCYPVVDRFYNDFRSKFGSCKCRELTNLDMKTPEGAEAYNRQVHEEVCNPIVAWAARRVHDLIKENS